MQTQQHTPPQDMSFSTPKSRKVGSKDTPWMQSTTSVTTPYVTDSEDAYMSPLSDSSKSKNRYSTAEIRVEKNTEGKPPYSYATLIKYAIERSADNKLTLSQIYQWVIDHYPYYGSAGSGWKVRYIYIYRYTSMHIYQRD
jgi:hypothetical protein